MALDPTLLSASSVTTYLRCGQQWYYGYVAGVKSPPTLKQARGLAVHKAVEVNMAQKVTTRIDLPTSDVKDAYSDEYDRLIGEVEERDAEAVGEFKDSGITLVEMHNELVAPSVQPVWVEQSVQFELNGIPYSGQVDVLDEMGRVRDWKTTARKPSPEGYLLNMTGYALAYRQLTGEVETDTVLDYLVATKKPYYLPIAAGGPVADQQIERFANIVENVSGGIMAGRFPPNGVVSGACSWCGYKAICPAYEQRMGALDFLGDE